MNDIFEVLGDIILALLGIIVLVEVIRWLL